MIAARFRPAISESSSSHLPPTKPGKPVISRAGAIPGSRRNRARPTMMIGIVRVHRWTAAIAEVAPARMTSGCGLGVSETHVARESAGAIAEWVQRWRTTPDAFLLAAIRCPRPHGRCQFAEDSSPAAADPIASPLRIALGVSPKRLRNSRLK